MKHPSKPQHMSIGQRNVLRSNDSSSLWNVSLSPGWNEDEVKVLRLALMKFGVGNWSKIIDSECLIGKTVAQINLQTQRLLGQQSLAEFTGLHIDPLQIGKLNIKKMGPEIKRKNGCIVNTGGKLSRDDKLSRLAGNRSKFGLTKAQIDEIVLPSQKKSDLTIHDLKAELDILKAELASVQTQIRQIRNDKEDPLLSNPLPTLQKENEIQVGSNEHSSPLSEYSELTSLSSLSALTSLGHSASDSE